VGTAVIRKYTDVVFVVDLMIPVTEDYRKMTARITVSGDMGRTLTVVVLA
jgi:hypothetical protein